MAHGRSLDYNLPAIATSLRGFSVRAFVHAYIIPVGKALLEFIMDSNTFDSDSLDCLTLVPDPRLAGRWIRYYEKSDSTESEKESSVIHHNG